MFYGANVDSALKERILYIGEFPPPYGGVTIKNSLLACEVFADCELDIIDLYRFKREKVRAPLLTISLIMAIKKANGICVGVGHPYRMCMIFRLVKWLRGEAFLSNISVFMMGASTPAYLQEHPSFISDVGKGRCIFVESKELISQFRELGCTNARYLPNFRKGDKARRPRPVGDVVHFVYFAQVRPEKGFDTLIEAVKKLNEAGFEGKYNVSVYGSIIDGYEKECERLIDSVRNVEYKGAFDTSRNDVYAELNQYDASVSSSWHEGMSGSNIECKFAGIANIVSDAGFNPECVRDREDGLLVKPGDVASLSNAMRLCIDDHNLLFRLKQESFDSRVEYDVASWRQEVLNVIERR